MVRAYIFFFFFFLTLPSFSIYTINKTYKLDLSNSAILCMFQDNRGYMWLGTYDGLNLYNSKHTFVYRFEMDNANSLSSNIIHKISQADDDHLWISTSLGLNKFSITERKVTESYYECPEARLLATDKDGNTWALTKKNYISYYTPRSKKFLDIHLPGANTENVADIFIGKDSQVNLIMLDGNIKSASLTSLGANRSDDLILNINERVFHNKKIKSAYLHDKGFYFVDVDLDLYFHNIESKSTQKLTELNSVLTSHDRISGILEFNNDIYISLKSVGVLKLEALKKYSPKRINSGLSIFCMLKDDKQDLLWIGTDGQGVKLYYQNHEMFHSILTSENPLLTQRPIRVIYTDRSNAMWIGTKGDGIIYIEDYTNSNRTTPTFYTIKNGLSNNNVFSLTQSSFHPIIWVGTEGPGLSYISNDDKSVKTIPSQRIGKVHQICEVNDSTLWLATAGNGLNEVKIKKHKGEFVIESVNEFILKKNDRTCNEFHAMIFDGNRTLFVGSRGGYGIVKFDILSKEYEFLQTSKGGNSAIGDVLSLHYSRDSIFYIGASSGLTKMQILDNDSVSIKLYDKRSGIANDMIHGILEDNEGFIWLSTNKGLTKFNPENNFFHNYGSPELPITEFSDDAYWRSDNDNRLFFGGVNGLVWIDPNQNLPASYQPKLQLFDLQIGDVRSNLDNYLTAKGHLELPASVNTFSISFIALDYISGDNYEYAYILENYNDSWVELQKENEATFVNLPSGDYTLKVRYKSDVEGVYEDDLVLHITKLAPWYLSTLALVVYILSFIIFCVYLVFEVNRRIAKKQARIARRIEKEAKGNLLEAKLDFYTNITHELCTPLTVINGISEYFENIDNALDTHNFNEYRSVLKENVNSLNDLIQEILDFRKKEESKLIANNIRQTAISDLLNQHLKSFRAIAVQNEITLSIDVQENIEWNTDLICFNRIFLNLISNAFKYSKKDGEIKVSAYKEDEYLILKVYNTGVGIEESELPYIFDRYHILESIEPQNIYSDMSTRNGIGLYLCKNMATQLGAKIEATSKVNKFAEFVVTFPQLETTRKDTLSFLESAHDPIIDPKSANLNLEKQTVLVIDDNHNIVWYLKEVLKEEYNVVSTHSVKEAFESITTHSPALIITDIMMPETDGLEFIEQLKKNKFTKQIPIIIISAKVSDRDRAEGLDVGADAYLSKPFSSLVLHATIKRLLTTKEELKEYYYSPESVYEYTDGQLMHQVDKEFINEVVAIIDAYIEDENLGPEFIATKLDLNTRNLYRKFKKATTLSPSDFIKDYRFNLAAKLLITTNLTVLEVMYKVGINNKSYFYREFLKKYNTTPKEYRSNR